jgi:hypothetical protein
MARPVDPVQDGLIVLLAIFTTMACASALTVVQEVHDYREQELRYRMNVNERVYKHREAVAWDFAQEPEIEGVVVGFGETKMGDKLVKNMDIDQGGILRRVFLSAGLEETFKACAPGDGVKLRHIGLVKLDGGRTFRKFASAVWEPMSNTPVELPAGSK